MNDEIESFKATNLKDIESSNLSAIIDSRILYYIIDGHYYFSYGIYGIINSAIDIETLNRVFIE